MIKNRPKMLKIRKLITTNSKYTCRNFQLQSSRLINLHICILDNTYITQNQPLKYICITINKKKADNVSVVKEIQQHVINSYYL